MELNLAEVANIFNGKTPSKAEQRTHGHPVLKIKNVSAERKFSGVFDSFVDMDLAKKSEAKLIKLNDTLILNAAHNADYVGSKQYRAEKEVVNSLPTGEWLIVRSKNNKIDSIYLNYWLRLDATRFRIRHMVKGIHLYPKDVARLKIPLPPLAEQQKIAAILDAADSLRQKDQQLIEHHTALSQSLFLEMFGDPVSNPMGWEKSELGNHIEYIGDIGSNGANAIVAKNLVMNDFEDYAIMIRTVNLNSNNFSKNIKYISKETYDFFAKSKIYGGEIIMNKIGSAGKFWIMPNLKKPVSLGLNQLVIRLKNLNTQFLYYYLSTGYCQAIIESSTRGAVTKSITKLAVKKLPLMYPAIEFQNQFAERIQAIEAQKQQAQASLKKSETLFNSLLQRAFKGELTA